MGALRLMQAFSEDTQVDPLGLIAAAFAYRAGDVTGIFMSLAILGSTYWQVSFATAVLALDEILGYDDICSFLGL